jgi:hypothetical protein
MTCFVNKRIIDPTNVGIKDQEIRENIPEVNGTILLGIMETPQEEDFDAIINILTPAKEHELKSILRVLGTSNPAIVDKKPDRDEIDYPDWQGTALREGVRILMSFGRDILSGYDDYYKKLKVLLHEKEIIVR